MNPNPVAGLRARERANTHWKSRLSTTSLECFTALSTCEGSMFDEVRNSTHWRRDTARFASIAFRSWRSQPCDPTLGLRCQRTARGAGGHGGSHVTVVEVQRRAKAPAAAPAAVESVEVDGGHVHRRGLRVVVQLVGGRGDGVELSRVAWVLGRREVGVELACRTRARGGEGDVEGTRSV